MILNLHSTGQLSEAGQKTHYNHTTCNHTSLGLIKEDGGGQSYHMVICQINPGVRQPLYGKTSAMGLEWLHQIARIWTALTYSLSYSLQHRQRISFSTTSIPSPLSAIRYYRHTIMQEYVTGRCGFMANSASPHRFVTRSCAHAHVDDNELASGCIMLMHGQLHRFSRWTYRSAAGRAVSGHYVSISREAAARQENAEVVRPFCAMFEVQNQAVLKDPIGFFQVLLYTSMGVRDRVRTSVVSSVQNKFHRGGNVFFRGCQGNQLARHDLVFELQHQLFGICSFNLIHLCIRAYKGQCRPITACGAIPISLP